MSEMKTGGPAFPLMNRDYQEAYGGAPGMTLRDWFATVVDKNEYGDILYRNMTNELAEELAGPRPVQPDSSAGQGARIAWRKAELDWHLKTRAVIRYRMADAMLAAREVAK